MIRVINEFNFREHKDRLGLTSEKSALEFVSIEDTDAIACWNDEATIVLVEVHAVDFLHSAIHLFSLN